MKKLKQLLKEGEMKKLIRKILKEQDDINIHPDYEGVLESPNDAIFPITWSELKIGLMLMREKFVKSIWKSNVRLFRKELKDKYAINNDEILTRMTLIFYFNEYVDLEDALNFKELSYIYRGPFYECEMEYYGELETTYEYEDEECYDCGGHGEEECPECGGSGWYDEETQEECPECDGHGQINCGICDGDMVQEIEVEYHTLNEMSASIISKEPIDMLNYRKASEILKDSNLLISNEEWTDERREREGDEWELEQNEGKIITIHSYDIMSNKDILNFSFF